MKSRLKCLERAPLENRLYVYIGLASEVTPEVEIDLFLAHNRIAEGFGIALEKPGNGLIVNGVDADDGRVAASATAIESLSA